MARTTAPDVTHADTPHGTETAQSAAKSAAARWPRGAGSEIGFHAGQDLRPLTAGEAFPPFVRDLGEVLRVCAPDGLALLRQLVEPLGGVITDRLEHREPAVTVLVEAADEALIDGDATRGSTSAPTPPFHAKRPPRPPGPGDPATPRTAGTSTFDPRRAGARSTRSCCAGSADARGRSRVPPPGRRRARAASPAARPGERRTIRAARQLDREAEARRAERRSRRRPRRPVGELEPQDRRHVPRSTNNPPPPNA